MATFRKSKKIGGVRVTLSPSGVSASAGVKGARVSANTKGEVHRTISAPGTGIYDRKKIAGPTRSGKSHEAPTEEPSTLAETPPYAGDLIDGYGARVGYNGDLVHVQATSRVGKAALGAEAVTVARSDITDWHIKPAGRMTNGSLTMHLLDGRRIEVHFLRKHQADFDALSRRLG